MKTKTNFYTKILCVVLLIALMLSFILGSVSNKAFAMADADSGNIEGIIDIYNNDLVFTPIEESMFQGYGLINANKINLNDRYNASLNDNNANITSVEPGSTFGDPDVKALIEKQLKQAGTDVESELNKQIESYNNMLASATSQEEKNQIQNIIAVIERQITVYKSNQDETKPFVSGSVDSLEALLPAALAFFNLNGYDLSAELLAHSMSITEDNTIYKPNYRHRVLASPVTYEIAMSPVKKENPAFPRNIGGTFENDLYYAIHGFKYEKLNNDGYLKIWDDYDFDTAGDHGGIIDLLMEQFDKMMNAGILKKYKVQFNINVYDFLYISTVYKSGNKWRINVSNFSNEQRDVMYNATMCDGISAKLWQALSDLKVFSMPARSSTVVEIEEFFTHITFSHIKNDIRYISYGYELAETNPWGEGFTESGFIIPKGYMSFAGFTQECNSGEEDFAILSRVSGFNWIVKITNPFADTATVQYNTKMCFEDDAIHWKNLYDIDTYTLKSGESFYAVIYGNWAATTIAVRISTSKDERIVYANEIDGYCNMKLGRVNFLRLEYRGKSSNEWYIYVYNSTGHKIILEFNSKLCFEADASNWRNLKDVVVVENIEPNPPFPITVKNNWFAQTLAVSYVDNGRRIISYAYDLNLGNSMTRKYRVI